MSETDLCGGNMRDVITKASAACRCQGQFSQMAASVIAGAGDDPSGPVTGATSAALSSYAKLTACTVDAGMSPSDNKAAQLASASGGGWMLLMGPEIDLKT